MDNILVIGAGGVSQVTVHKMAQNPRDFKNIILASRSIEKCFQIKKSVKDKYNINIAVAELDADNIYETVSLIKKFNPFLVVNLALPYQDLNIMDACLLTNAHYLDTANYEPRNKAKFEYKWQWDYDKKFKEKGLMALLGSGFDPILDCNDGDHGHPFATNFNPEINIREVTSDSKHWEDNQWKIGPALKKKVSFKFPEIGNKNMYLMYHEDDIR